MNATLTPPPERDLPPGRHGALRRAAVQAVQDSADRRPRPRIVIAAAAVVVVCLVVPAGVVGLVNQSASPPTGPGPAGPGPTAPPPPPAGVPAGELMPQATWLPDGYGTEGYDLGSGETGLTAGPTVRYASRTRPDTPRFFVSVFEKETDFVLAGVGGGPQPVTLADLAKDAESVEVNGATGKTVAPESAHQPVRYLWWQIRPDLWVAVEASHRERSQVDSPDASRELMRLAQGVAVVRASEWETTGESARYPFTLTHLPDGFTTAYRISASQSQSPPPEDGSFLTIVWFIKATNEHGADVKEWPVRSEGPAVLEVNAGPVSPADTEYFAELVASGRNVDVNGWACKQKADIVACPPDRTRPLALQVWSAILPDDELLAIARGVKIAEPVDDVAAWTDRPLG